MALWISGGCIEIDALCLKKESARSRRESEDEWRGLKPYT